MRLTYKSEAFEESGLSPTMRAASSIGGRPEQSKDCPEDKEILPEDSLGYHFMGTLQFKSTFLKLEVEADLGPEVNKTSGPARRGGHSQDFLGISPGHENRTEVGIV